MQSEPKETYVRKQLLATLLLLLKTQPIDELSITELVKQAGVGRVSFYRHYKTIADILVQENRRLFALWKRQQEEKEKEGKPANFSRSLLNFYKEHSDFYLAVYRAGMQEIIMDTILASMEIREDDPNPTAYFKSSIGYMIYGWVHEWMKRGMQESGDQLDDMIQSSAPAK